MNGWRSFGLLDLNPVIEPEETTPFTVHGERSGARIGALVPLTVAERFEAFAWMGFKPHGIYLPHNERITADLRRRVRELGDIADVDARLGAYSRLQDETEAMYLEGIEGRWTGQQAWARSEARFRQVAASRRTGKTLYAACETIAMLRMRPRSLVWIASGTMHSASRCFEMVLSRVTDLKSRGMEILAQRNSRDEKFIRVTGGGLCVGVSLDERAVEVGAAVDLAIIDEANEISRDSWLHTVLPPLADRNGKAFMISSYRGQENFFYERSQEKSSDWEFFESIQWEDNFYAFPQGRQSPAIQAAERESSEDMASFLEEYGNIPTGTRRAVYPQYRDAVHAGEYPYKPGHPVMLTIDPSAGANEYAVGVVQDFGHYAHVIDEYYQAGASAEDAMASIEQRVWIKDVASGLCDSASPIDIRRWRERGYDILAVDKPLVEDRIPVYRKLLRDPWRFFRLFQYLSAEVLSEWGDPTPYDELPVKMQNLVYMEIEGKLAPTRLTPYLIEELKMCSRIFINEETCPNTMREHRTYQYRKIASSRNASPETPKKWKDHLVDALCYWAWMYKRFDVVRDESRLSYSYLRVAGRPDIDELVEESPVRDPRLTAAADEIGAEIVSPVPVSSGFSWLKINREMGTSSAAPMGRSGIDLRVVRT